MKLKLSKPIPVEDRTVNELEIREEVSAGDLEAMDAASSGGAVARSIYLIAHLTNVPPSSIRAMRASDFNKANALVQPFLDGGPQTGVTSVVTSRLPSDSPPTKSSG